MNKSKSVVRFPYTLSRFSLNITQRAFNAILAVKGQKPLINHLLMITKLVVGKITPNWVRLVVILLRKTSPVYKDQGCAGYVKYLKTASILIQQFSAGYIVPDITVIGPRISRTKSGLPRLIPSIYRKRIRQGDVLLIKVILTLLSVFRVAIYSANPKLSTITKDRTTSFSLEVQLYNHIPRALKAIVGRIKAELKEKPVFMSTSASPNSRSKYNEYSTHPISILRSLSALTKDPIIFPILNRLIKGYSGIEFNYFFRNICTSMANLFASGALKKTDLLTEYKLGKIGLKQEAAGKVRVFAMVDPFTQWVLKPLHSWIFSVLRRIPMDGTFNQLGPIKAYPNKGPIWSFDLSAATDRLPLSFQKRILAHLFGQTFSND
jgi:hypothetical protein